MNCGVDEVKTGKSGFPNDPRTQESLREEFL